MYLHYNSNTICVEVFVVSEYKEPYRILFTSITRAIENIDRGYVYGVRQLLVEAQLEAEEAFVSYTESEEAEE